ncbi:hypothetical protein B0H14DRAFT_2556687 [Mycena olivaceomarginata]|nr:hypothetical protein B0H14DRAFT_2556687 [Mycena olivaceomarginata]
MPPKGSGKTLSAEGFIYNEDNTKVQCKTCAAVTPEELRTWIGTKGAVRHLSSTQHLQSVELADEARRRQERLEKEGREDAATTELRDIQLSAQHFQGPVASSSSRVMSEAEAEMWADYGENGANFWGEKQLREEAESFGLWNPEAMACRLGFGDEDMLASMVDKDEEDDFLAEFLGNIGESSFETRVAVGAEVDG